MNRDEWFEKQSLSIQNCFIKNCIKANGKEFFETWILAHKPITEGILGAFIFSDTDEGFDFWKVINDKFSEKGF